jgi:hypothetical protein
MVLLDNASYHKSVATSKKLTEYTLYHIWNVPYVPELNDIERVLTP